jgi:hypothetical protein
MHGTQNNFFGQVIAGLAVVMILIPGITKALGRDHVNLNGLVLDFAEVVLEAVTQRDWNFGDPARVDSNWEAPE